MSSPEFHSASGASILTAANPNPTTILFEASLYSIVADLPLGASLVIANTETSLSSYVPKTPVFGALSVIDIG
jgi:hypothetical protein